MHGPNYGRSHLDTLEHLIQDSSNKATQEKASFNLSEQSSHSESPPTSVSPLSICGAMVERMDKKISKLKVTIFNLIENDDQIRNNLLDMIHQMKELKKILRTHGVLIDDFSEQVALPSRPKESDTPGDDVIFSFSVKDENDMTRSWRRFHSFPAEMTMSLTAGRLERVTASSERLRESDGDSGQASLLHGEAKSPARKFLHAVRGFRGFSRSDTSEMKSKSAVTPTLSRHLIPLRKMLKL